MDAVPLDSGLIKSLLKSKQNRLAIDTYVHKSYLISNLNASFNNL